MITNEFLKQCEIERQRMYARIAKKTAQGQGKKGPTCPECGGRRLARALREQKPCTRCGHVAI